ncbi:MAG: CCA tRNA nucleotidyltransferase [Planctomycetota bacterium]|jgi:tRNA nucleotidyltransferase/poly(A) polymerase
MSNRESAIKVVNKLRSRGFEALLAGGCVRDMLLCRRANDHDVATDARPGDVIRLFKRTLKVGAKFGVVIVLLRDKQVEVATFRTETGYADGRHPGKIEFSNAREDAARRDFTINGMFYDPLEKKVLDFVGGQRDLSNRIIRTIGKAEERFGEDYLRMLRAVRFSTQLGFEIEAKTFAAIRGNARNITRISGERICMELEGILVDTNRSAGMSLLARSGLADEIFPGLSAEQINFAVKVLGYLRKKVDFALSLTAFFVGCDTDFAVKSCKILKLSRNQEKHIKYLLANRGRLLDNNMSLAQLKMFLAEPYFRDLFELQKAIQKVNVGGRKGIEPLIALRRRIKKLGDVELQPKPLLNGHELMSLGASPGARLGQLAEEMYIEQLEGVLQDKTQAEQWVKKWLGKHKDS